MSQLPFEIQQLPCHEHTDAIHHVEFDFHGRRIATASSDKYVCVWDRDSSGLWKRTAHWKSHGGAVWKVRWAHPTFGQILATCSFDNTVHIFEEIMPESDGSLSRTGIQAGRSDSSNNWRKRRNLVDVANVTDIQFAPHFLGLILATCNANGRVLIYEADDVMDLENWTTLIDVEVFKTRCGSLAWSTNRFHKPLIAVCSDDLNAKSDEKLKVYEFQSIYRSNELVQKETFSELHDQLAYVSFAPSAGLSYHKLAVAVGQKILIYHIHVQVDENTKPNEHHEFMDFTSLQTDRVSTLESGKSQVLRISWNIIGDTLSAVYADGVVRLWKCTFKNDWDVVSVVQPPTEASSSRQGPIYY